MTHQLPLPGTDFVLRHGRKVERYSWVPDERYWEDEEGRWWWLCDVPMLQRVIALPELGRET
jgi:hypothetical protein